MRRAAFFVLAGLPALLIACGYALRPAHDLVITNVHYLRDDKITPELYAVAVSDGRVSYIGKDEPRATQRLDGRGKVLAPGFLDTNVPGFILAGRPSEIKLRDGVTSYLSAHGGLPGDNLSVHGRRTVLNYATTVGLTGMHERLADPSVDVLAELEHALVAGAYGISLSPEYEPDDASPERVRAICERFGPRGVPISFHARHSSVDRELDGVEEAFECACAGAPVHVLHLSSTGGTHHAREAVAVVERARRMGHTMLFDFYPYTAWASSIQRARFRGDWLARYGVKWEQVWLPGRARHLDADTFEELRSTGRHWVVAVESIPRATVDYFALQTDAPIGSDTATGGAVHPRGAGSFAKFLRDYVALEDGASARDRVASHTDTAAHGTGTLLEDDAGARGREPSQEATAAQGAGTLLENDAAASGAAAGKLSLAQALYRLSTLAHERFAPYVPDLERRGRIELGYAADLVLWDPARIRDNATFSEPNRPSDGVELAFVNGNLVLRDGKLVIQDQETGRWMQGRFWQQ